jgi:hypothetical protein
MLTGVIFSNSDNFISREIKHVTREPDSHVALLFDDTVLHFRFLGFESMDLEEFKMIYKVNDILVSPEAVMVSKEAVIRQYHGKAYDFLGMIYVAFYLGFRDMLGIVLPGGNYWQNKRDRFCVSFGAEVCLGEAGTMWTPTQFKNILLKKGWKNARN